MAKSASSVLAMRRRLLSRRLLSRRLLSQRLRFKLSLRPCGCEVDSKSSTFITSGFSPAKNPRSKVKVT